MLCPHCNIDLEIIVNKANRANHVRWCLQNPNRKNKLKKICPECNTEHIKRGKCCSSKCARQKLAKEPEWRKNVSKGRIKFLKENPDKHPWKNNDKFKSNPCETLKKYFIENDIKFIEEYQPLENKAFSIDIAFPDIKLGIEVNGNQHYNKNGTLKPYYQKRHNLICNEGWKLIELHYLQCYNEEIIKNLIQKWEQPDYKIFIKEKEQKVSLPKGEKFKENCKLKWSCKIEEVKNSNIDFSKFGWVGKVSQIIGISPQKTGAWIKRYLPEIYENAYKRK